MTSFLRGKHSGIQSDLSAGLTAQLFALDHVAQYGINSKISAVAYDPIQSLLAVGTSDSRFGSGQIYVFGQKRVSVVLPLPRKASVRTLVFCGERLVSLDSKNDVAVYSLESKQLTTTYAPPGVVTAILTDPALDYAFIGLQNGDVIAYDMDRQAPAPFKIINPWRERNPRARVLPVVTLALHPRDLGQMLIGYAEGAVIFSFKQNKHIKFFQYRLEPGAPGGQPDTTSNRNVRLPKLSHAVWHPTGTFIVTAHEDSSLVFWDSYSKDGRMIQARTLQNTNVNRPGAPSSIAGSAPGTFSLKSPVYRIAWCNKQNSEDTGLLIAGGVPTTNATQSISFLDLGVTPVYATSSWSVLNDYFEKPKGQYTLPTPPNAEVVDFCLIPRTSPHFAGSSDPIALIAIMSSGETITMSFPSGHPISPTNLLHPSMSFIQPFAGTFQIDRVDRTRWLGMTEKRVKGPIFVHGGAGATHPLKRYEQRNIIQTAHNDGTIRIWDAGHADQIENESMIQVDYARALGRSKDVNVTKMSMSGATGELVVGSATGEVAIFRWGFNKNQKQSGGPPMSETLGLLPIVDRAEPSVGEGLLPLTLLNQQRGPVTAVKMSDVGFVAAGFEDGGIAIIDLRGPAVIYTTTLNDISKPSKRGSIHRRTSTQQQQSKLEWPTIMDFGVMNLEDEEYSSILLFVGSNYGRLATFKILPQPNGGYAVQLAGVVSLEDRIVSISPIRVDNGHPAYATQSAVGGLRSGVMVNGLLLVVTSSSARIFRPAAAKGASKAWDQYLCDSATVATFGNQDFALVGLFGDGCTRAYTIPGLKEIASIKIGHIIDVRRLGEAVITPTGDIFGWTGPSELALLNVWGTKKELVQTQDKLFNPELLVPPRPTISNIQWMSGTQYVTPSDMDLLVGGPERPPSKRMVEQMRSEEQQARQAGRSGLKASNSSTGDSQEGYLAYMQRQMQERTEKLNIMGDSMDQLQESSSQWGEDVSKFVSQQKRNAVKGIITSKLGF